MGFCWNFDWVPEFWLLLRWRRWVCGGFDEMGFWRWVFGFDGEEGGGRWKRRTRIITSSRTQSLIGAHPTRTAPTSKKPFSRCCTDRRRFGEIGPGWKGRTWQRRGGRMLGCCSKPRRGCFHRVGGEVWRLRWVLAIVAVEEMGLWRLWLNGVLGLMEKEEEVDKKKNKNICRETKNICG